MQRGCAAALTAALLLLAAPACALERAAAPVAFGGSGEDRLEAVVPCADGWFAVGSTASVDGDLSMRTRKGETGWALRLDTGGGVRFSFCRGRSGMTRMAAPAAFEDGTQSMVLTDEAMQHGEWIVLNAQGEAASCTTIDGAQALCPQGEMIVQLLPVLAQGEAVLAALVRHADGTLCVSQLKQDGAARPGEPFEGGEAGRLCADAEGNIAYASARDGAVHLLALDDGAASAALCDQSYGEPMPATVADARLAGDGSVTLCGTTQSGGGYLLRISRSGERLFMQETDAPLTCLTETETGYAALSSGRILFADEDGASLAWADAPQDALAIASAPGGVMALAHDALRGRRQAVFTRVAQPVLSETPEPASVAAGAEPAVQTDVGGGGHLLCSAQGALGVQVRYVDEDGAQRFCVRTPIHTAADELQWLCAAHLDGGDMLLGGRYLYGSGAQARQQGVTALLSGDGVLRAMETADGAGAVCGIAVTPDGEVLLHAARDEAPSIEPDAVIVYGYPR